MVIQYGTLYFARTDWNSYNSMIDGLIGLQDVYVVCQDRWYLAKGSITMTVLGLSAFIIWSMKIIGMEVALTQI